jgi:hypothetical protein
LTTAEWWRVFTALKPGGYLYLQIPYDGPGKRIYREEYFAALMAGLMKSTSGSITSPISIPFGYSSVTDMKRWCP